MTLKGAQLYENKKAEKEAENWLSGIAFPSEEELMHIFKSYNWLFVIGKRDTIWELYERCPFDFDELSKELIAHHCIIVKYVDLGADGKILNFIEK